MFFFLSKLFDVLLSPLTWGLALVAMGLPLRQRFRWQRLCPLAGIAVLWLFAIEPVANLLQRCIETPQVRTMRANVAYDAVILLGGIVDIDSVAEFGQGGFNDNTERLLATYDVLRTGRARYAILSGGAYEPKPDVPSEAEVLANQLAQWGIERSRLIIEGHSRNTRENAVDSAKIVRERGWRTLLVITSAFHMPRALGCFRAVGLPVDTLPVDFRSHRTELRLNSLLPRATALAESAEALHELSGRLIYRIRGYSRRAE